MKLMEEDQDWKERAIEVGRTLVKAQDGVQRTGIQSAETFTPV